MDPKDNRRSGRKRWHSFADAFRGLTHALQTEPNARIHAVIAAGALAAGWALHISAGEWIAIVLCIGLVFAAECFNTAVEYLADRITTLHDPVIGHAKDLAAAAVLSVSLASAAIGAIVFLPKLIALFA